MFTASRISKKTFFAAAALGLASALSVVAADYSPSPETAPGSLKYDFDDYSYTSSWVLTPVGGYSDFVKAGTGDLRSYVYSSGGSLYNLHYLWFDKGASSNFGVAEYTVLRNSKTGEVVESEDNYVPGWHGEPDSKDLLEWQSGEVRVEGGILELIGYVNAWFDFGPVFNNHFEKEGYGTANGKMTGATRVTVADGAVLDLAGNVNVNKDSTFGYMVSRNYKTVFQFLHNLQAGDYGNAQNSVLRLGSSPSLHVNIHIDGWDENTRVQRVNGGYLDNSPAFGGSVGVLEGNAAVYKTGSGDFTLLNTSAGFSGELYAAGGELTLAGNNSAGLGLYSFKDWNGNVVWKAKISSAYANAESVNIAGTYRDNGANGESRQGSAVRYKEMNAVLDTSSETTVSHHSQKEAYFTTPEAGTLVIAENQKIRNFQSYFNAGFAVAPNTSAADAVQAAGNISVEYARNGITAGGLVATAPIIVGTGTGSKVVIPGGNYKVGASGEWELQTDAKTGEMLGGVLFIDQEEGMGGIYEGAIVGCRVTVYDRKEFNDQTSADPGTPSERLEAVKVGETELKNALTAIYGNDSKYAELNVAADGSFALDNAVAWDVVNYYKTKNATSESDASGNPEESFYVDYQADAGVTGGILALDGEGDLAILLEQSNFSGINIAATRKGKTVVNISTLNALPGSVSSLGGSVSVVSTQKDTLKTKLSFATGSRLIFTTGETIRTAVRDANGNQAWDSVVTGGNTILVGDIRKSVVAFETVQDGVLGNVYVERGVDLDLAGAESIFPNASSLTLWSGSVLREGDGAIAASSLTLKGAATGTNSTYVQVFNNLTGDATSMVDLGSGVFIANVTENEEDPYSGLTHGVFNGLIRGEGSVVKGGNATLTLGSNRNIYTGTTEVGAGTLNVSNANGIANSSALLLNAGTTVTMVDGQTLRNLFGAAGTSVTVGTVDAPGALTVGSNAAVALGDNRPLLANNLGTASSGNYYRDNSFARFTGNYDREGNLLTGPGSASGSSQKKATQDYLTATARLAYSGFDASVLEQFVGKENYDGTELLSKSDYESVLAYGKNQFGTVTVAVPGANSGVTLTEGGLLGELSGIYQKLQTSKFYLDNIGKTNGYYNPDTLLRRFFGSDSEYRAYLEDNGLSVPPNETEVQQVVTNKARFEKIVSEYERLSGIANTEALEKVFTSEAAVRAKFNADFGSVKNLGGTTLQESLGDKTVVINTTFAEFGIALEACASLEKKLLDPALTDLEEEALIRELEAWEKKIYDPNGLLETIVGYYNELDALKAEIAAKSQFSGISVAGAFAGEVTVGGALVNQDWINELAYAGTLTVSSLTKIGDNTLTLTGTLAAQKVVVEAGTLAVNLSALPATLPGGIAIERGANFSVNVATGEEKTFDYAISGYGNFVKTGAGTLVLPDSVLYTGTTTIEGGVLQMTLREAQMLPSGSFLAVQDDIFITGEGAGLILAQDDDITWTHDLTASADNAFVKKIGGGALEISGNVALTGDDIALTVSEGKLKLSGKTNVGTGTLFTIEKGAMLSVAELSGTYASSVAVRGSGAFDIVAADGKTVALKGAGIKPVEPIPANGQGLTWDAFYGTVSVSGGTLSLSGESLFDYARGVVVSSGAKLAVQSGSTQKLQTIAGTGELALAGTLSVANDSGVRLGWDWTSTKSYIFDEGKLFDAPTFSGTVSGNGKLEISGRGLMGFTGTLESNVSVVGGGQVMLDAKNANEAQAAGKTLSVGGAATRYEDAQGRTIVGGYTNGAATNYSSGVNANIPAGAFYANSAYVPRTFTASYTDAAGNKISVAPENITTDASGNLIDSVSRREVSLVVTEWDYADNGKLSANWTVFDAEGNVVDLSKTTDAIVWDAQAKKFVLGAYTDKNENTQNYRGGFRWLAEAENEDGSVSLVFADVSKVKSEKLTSELILSADAGTQSDGIALSTGLIKFSAGGLFGKVGDGTLSVGGADLESDKNCGGVNVYEGELKLTGGEWVLEEANAARVALGATLTVELDGSNSPDFESVYGSGTLKLTTSEGKKVDLAIAESSSDGLAVLPTYASNGKFFNGIMSFDGNFSVSIADVEMSAVNTSASADLTLDRGVTLIQTQNTEIRGGLSIAGAVTVKGTSAAAGYADSAESRRLTVLPDGNKNFTIDSGSGSLTLQNVGFGYAAEAGVNVIIDYASVANTFYYNLKENGTVNSNGLIDLKSNSTPGQGFEEPQLKSLSMIMVGENDDTVRKISGKDLSENLGATSGSKDSVFSISSAVYSQLAYRNGTFNIGVESGTLEISDWDQFTGTTANDVNIEFLALRSNISDTAGTIKITGKNGVSARTLSGDYGTLSKTISGGGNVEFSDPAGTLVTAKQNYLGFTTVSGKVHFTGAGEENHSSQVTVLNGAEMHGGLQLAGRNVSATGSVSRNLSETGGAGTATLKLELADPRLPKAVTVQVEIDGVGNISSPKIYAENSLNDDYGISVKFAEDSLAPGGYAAIKDGKLELQITDDAYGDTYSIFLPVDINTFPSKAGATLAYSAPAIPVATKFTLENGAKWIADITDGDGLAATNVELQGTIKLEGLSSSEALGKNVKLVSADTINGISKSEIESVVRRSNAVAEALRKGNPEESVMIYTDADGNVNVRVINDNFDIDGVDYSDAVSPSFLAALSELAGGADADRGVLNADSLLPGQDKELLFALNSMTAENLAKEVEKLSPSIFASMLAMPVAAFNSDTTRIHERLNQRRYDGADPLRETGEHEFFALAQGDFAENKSERDTPTFDYNLYGMTAGFDWKPNYETTLGFALGYTYGDAKAHNGGGKVDMDDMRITAFASRLLGTCYVDAGVQVGMAMFDTKRHTIAGTASGDTDSVFAGTFITVGSVYSIWQNVKEGSGLYFTPSIGLSYLHTQIDGFSESGVAGLNLDDMEGDSLRARIAASIQWEFPLETWKVRLGLEAAYAHDFLGDELDTDGRFAVGGSAFSASAKALPTDIFSLGPTVDIMVSERSSLYFGYGVEIDTDSGVSQNVNAGFRHRF